MGGRAADKQHRYRRDIKRWGRGRKGEEYQLTTGDVQELWGLAVVKQVTHGTTQTFSISINALSTMKLGMLYASSAFYII